MLTGITTPYFKTTSCLPLPTATPRRTDVVPLVAAGGPWQPVGWVALSDTRNSALSRDFVPSLGGDQGPVLSKLEVDTEIKQRSPVFLNLCPQTVCSQDSSEWKIFKLRVGRRLWTIYLGKLLCFFLNLPFHISRNFYQEILLILPTLFNNECNEGSLGQDLCSMPEISQTPASTLCPCVRQWNQQLQHVMIIYWGKGLSCQKLPTEIGSLMWVMSPSYV